MFLGGYQYTKTVDGQLMGSNKSPCYFRQRSRKNTSLSDVSVHLRQFQEVCFCRRRLLRNLPHVIHQDVGDFVSKNIYSRSRLYV